MASKSKSRTKDYEKANNHLSPIPTNEHGQACKLQLCACKAKQITTFHITWITFWLCFFIWFCTTNMYDEISTDINLTLTQHQLAGTLSVTSTIVFRVLISDFCFKYGSRFSYIIILISTILSLIGMALIQDAIGYIIFHVFLGIAGASFVVTQYHTTRMFSSQIVGFAQAMTAGFGNFGGGCANFIMPLLMQYTNLSWRWYMVMFAAIAFLFCFLYYFATSDAPILPSDYASPPTPQCPIDLIHLEEEIDKIKPPDKQIGMSFRDAFSDYRTWILFTAYAACFGVEITFYLVAAHYFQIEYNLTEIESGLIVMIWSAMNIFARPLGGFVSDKYDMERRVKMLFAILLVESIFLILFGIIGHLSVYAAVVVSLLFSICIQTAQGVVFNITPLIQPKSVGHVIGIVASGGNLGATFFIFAIFLPWRSTDLDEQYTWVIVGGIVMVISFITLRIKFTEREMHDFDQQIQACYDLDRLETHHSFGTTTKTMMEAAKNKSRD
eukprot:246384_1